VNFSVFSFLAAMADCDFSRPFIIGYGSSPSRHGPAGRRSRPARLSKYRELTHMPGSSTTPDQTSSRDDAPPCVGFRSVNSVGVQNKCLSRLDG
jgi:hypothetical protein